MRAPTDRKSNAFAASYDEGALRVPARRRACFNAFLRSSCTMTARSIGEIALGQVRAKATRSFQPVRRNSYYASDRRSTALWRPIAPNSRDARRVIAARLKAAEFYDRKHKQAGKWNGPLGAIGLEVLRELYRIVDFKTGRLDPAIATICEKLRRSKQAVVDALARLKEHGFLDWVRRSEPIDDAEGAGPRVRQITNAYGFSLPKCASAWVAGILGRGPTPDCELARQEADRANVEAMLDQASTDEIVDFTVGDGQLAEILKKIGSSLSKNSASLPNEKKPASE